jgi:hypothetical protein
MAEFRIRGVIKADGLPHERIRGVKLSNGNQMTVGQVLDALDKGDLFYIFRSGKVLRVEAGSYAGRRYIKTEFDASHPTTLLDLPELS